MNRKMLNCPHCGRILPADWVEIVTNPNYVKEPLNVKCPKCQGSKVWKDSRYYTAYGEVIQRYLCRECGIRFSTR
jgi:transposase-like protein